MGKRGGKGRSKIAKEAGEAIEEAVEKLTKRGGRGGHGRGGDSGPDRRTVPHGFDSFQEYQEYAGGLRNRIRERYPDVEMGFQGSAVTGRSHDTGRPFDEGRTSDFDIALSGDSLHTAARERGVPFRGDGVSTGPLTDEDLHALGLRDIARQASADAGGRQVNFMIYRTIEEATSRKPTIRVWF